MNNFSDIIDRVNEYIDANQKTDTKSLASDLNKDYIFEVILGPLVDYYEENVPGFSLPAE